LCLPKILVGPWPIRHTGQRPHGPTAVVSASVVPMANRCGHAWSHRMTIPVWIWPVVKRFGSISLQRMFSAGMVGGVAQWLGRRSLAGDLSLIYG